MAKQKMEKVLEYIINDEEDRAKSLLHQIIVDQARNIHESLIEDEELTENFNSSGRRSRLSRAQHLRRAIREQNKKKDFEDEISDEDEDIASLEDEIDAEEAFEDDDNTGDVLIDKDGDGDDVDNDEDLEERVEDIEDTVDELKAKVDDFIDDDNDSEEFDNMDFEDDDLNDEGDDGIGDLEDEYNKLINDDSEDNMAESIRRRRMRRFNESRRLNRNRFSESANRRHRRLGQLNRNRFSESALQRNHRPSRLNRNRFSEAMIERHGRLGQLNRNRFSESRNLINQRRKHAAFKRRVAEAAALKAVGAIKSKKNTGASIKSTISGNNIKRKTQIGGQPVRFGKQVEKGRSAPKPSKVMSVNQKARLSAINKIKAKKMSGKNVKSLHGAGRDLR